MVSSGSEFRTEHAALTMDNAPLPPPARALGRDRPGPVIAAFLGHQTVGDFAVLNLAAASYAQASPGSRLLVIYRDDRPYKNFLVRLNPWITSVIRLPDDPRAIFPLNWFDGTGGGVDGPFTEAQKAEGLHRPDILLVPGMTDVKETSFLQPAPALRIPDDEAPLLAEKLARRGVDPGRWFVCLHMREGEYMWRKRPDKANDSEELKRAFKVREVDPMTYLPMVESVIRDHGGQVVRIGDPSMMPLPEMDGLVDLSQDGDSFEEQVFAISRARFFFGTASGPVAIACALKTPVAATNAQDLAAWNPGDVMKMKKVILPDGSSPPPRDTARVLGPLPFWIAEIDYEDNTPEELLEVADYMLAQTTDVTAWREDPPPATAPRPESGIELPHPYWTIDDIDGLVWM